MTQGGLQERRSTVESTKVDLLSTICDVCCKQQNSQDEFTQMLAW